MTGAVRTVSRHKATAADDGGGPGRHDVLLPLAGTQAKVHRTGLLFPRNLPERSWEQIGTNLRELVNSSAWWLADWLIYGEATYGWRRYKEAIERTGLDYQTLRNYAWVARRFEHDRRRDGLSFAHHAEVARLAPPEQDYWLRKAEQQKWSRNELRRAVRAGLAVQNDTAEVTPGTPGEQRDAPRPAAADRSRPQVATLTIELSAGPAGALRQGRRRDGLPVDKWVARLLETTDRPVPGARTA